MTKSFLIAAGCLLVASAAWAGPPPGPEGSGNNVSTALNPPAPQTAAAPATEAPRKAPDIGVPGSGNNVNAALNPPAPVQPAQTQAQGQMSAQGSGQMASQPFNAGAYASAADCMNAAAAAHQPLAQCEGLKK
jgi:hypothetical protein